MLNRVNITVNQLIASDLFLGYHVANWNPRTNFFLVGKYKNTNIFNINFTYSLTKKFIFFLSELFVNKGHLWLVNENFSLFNRSVELCKLSGSFPEMSFLNSKWYKGMLSNYKYVSIVKPNKFPHGIFVANIQNNHYVVNEAFLINIPSVAIADTIDNPSNVFFPIPGNSKSLKTLFFFYILISKSLFYSRYTMSSKFLFDSVKSSFRGFSLNRFADLFYRSYFVSFRKKFLLEDIIFLFKSKFFSKRKFRFLFRKKLQLSDKTLLFRWKIPLLLISSIFKNVFYSEFFNRIVIKKRLEVKNSGFFKILISILA